jgi:hypothetical protein
MRLPWPGTGDIYTISTLQSTIDDTAHSGGQVPVSVARSV